MTIAISPNGTFIFQLTKSDTYHFPSNEARRLFSAAVLAVGLILAQEQQQQDQQQQQSPVEWQPKTIAHKDVKPFSQPEPVTISEKAGVKFKPQIDIKSGCVPYPAVNEAGETSGGLQESGSPTGGCRGSGHGSQIYGRSTWFNGLWAIMYSWYFPKDSPSSRLGHRHDWEHIVVFIDNPKVPEPKILGCSPSWHSGYNKYAPCPADVIDGSSVKVKYEHSWPLNHALDITKDAGTFQDLIMWDQMSDLARRALNDTKFGKANTPMNDWNFLGKVEKSWPFK
ncbi:Necrosis inducing protein [Phytophthora cactorum]|nr:Necrosis inducing protein [Phytophthora cactorum]